SAALCQSISPQCVRHAAGISTTRTISLTPIKTLPVPRAMPDLDVPVTQSPPSAAQVAIPVMAT
ncbi:hypothetical protein BgiBS90_018177, partial [Biomphalaria glabrata]